MLKDYPSDYIGLNARIAMTERLVETLEGAVLSRTRVTGLDACDSLGLARISVSFVARVEMTSWRRGP